jgi:hypothetical protein
MSACSYLVAVAKGNLKGILERPSFFVWPEQPLDLLSYDGRRKWINGLLVLRLNALAYGFTMPMGRCTEIEEERSVLTKSM